MLYPIGILLPILFAVVLVDFFKRWRESRKDVASGSGLVYSVGWFLCVTIFFWMVRWLECRGDVEAYGECLPRTGPENVFDILIFTPGIIVLAFVTYLIAYFFWFRKKSNDVSKIRKVGTIVPALFVTIAFFIWERSIRPEPFQKLEKSDDGKTYLLIHDYGYGDKCDLLVDEKPWQFKEGYRDAERGAVAAGVHKLKCKNIYGVGATIEIPEGFIYRYKAFPLTPTEK